MEISTHVLDTSSGRPAQGVALRLERFERGGWTPAGTATTDADGRARSLAGTDAPPGRYRLAADVGAYFAARGVTPFFPSVEVVFDAPPDAARLHVPILVSPFSFTTYRGS